MNNLSLFAGSGIGDWAAKQAGITTVAQCENDPCCLFCLEKLWPGVPKFNDIRILTGEPLRRLGRIDIISGGPPCQPTSLAGKGGGDKDSRWMWPETLRVVGEVQPRWLVFENPLGIRRRGLDGILGSLEEAGYACWPLVLPAYATGLRHHRKRFWIVANSDGDGLPRIQDLHSEEDRWWDASAESLALYSWARGSGTLAEVPGHADGLPGGLPPSPRGSLLRILGNAWSPITPMLIYRWIAEQERRCGY